MKPIQPVLAGFDAHLDALAETLAAPFRMKGKGGDRLRVTIRHARAFSTWSDLQDRRLADREKVTLVRAWLEGVRTARRSGAGKNRSFFRAGSAHLPFIETIWKKGEAAMANGVPIMSPARNAKTEALLFALSRLETPIGAALVVTDAEGKLRVFEWQDHEQRMQKLLDRFYGVGRARLEEGIGGRAAKPVLERLKAYFAGDLAAIDAIPADSAGTDFQRKCWKMLRKIPAGETWSYYRLAQRIGHPTAVRAVGAANGANPISVVVPCHRVIGADGSLTGYGGGVERKRWLLRHEGVSLDAD